MSARVTCYHCKGSGKLNLNGWREQTYTAVADGQTVLQVADALHCRVSTAVARLEAMRREGLLLRTRKKQEKEGSGPRVQWTYRIKK